MAPPSGEAAADVEKDDKNGEGQATRELTTTEAAIIEMMKRQSGVSGKSLAALTGDDEKKHAFWDTQPMPRGDRSEIPEGSIEPERTTEDIRAEPYNMPAGFEWADLDVTIDEQRKELYTLLALNYVEDDDCLFRFDYSEDFLNWALTPPGWSKELLLGVRATKTKKLVAFISAVPAQVHVYQKVLEKTVEINFLCVHKKLRSKRLAPVLIKEITRRVNLTGVFQAVYTAGVVLPVPVASARYYHRSLNPKKLIRVGFSRMSPRMTMARMIKLYKVPDKPASKLEEMKPEHVEGVTKLLGSYLEKFSLRVHFTEDEIAHWLLPRKGVINSYVVAGENGDITDFCSFYHLPSTILGKDDTLFAAYSYYNVATSMPLVDLMRDSLVMANKNEADVFNALNLMENDSFLEELKFGKGDGNLQYYIYNWSCPSMKPTDVGIVLL